jgi:hypothetical protein
MKVRWSKRLKYYLERILVLLSLMIIFGYIRLQGNMYEDLLAQFASCVNEAQYLGFYLPVFLISVFPIFNDILKEQVVVRQTNKWDYILYIFGEVCKSSAIYAFAISFGWFFIIGTGIDGWNVPENWIFIGSIFIGQFIGWTMAGMLEAMLYLVIKNLPLAFILCYFIFIATNLSLYVNTSQQLEYYIRIYEMMFHIELFGSIYTLINVMCFYLILISSSIWACYWIIKHHDFLDDGGTRVHATKESDEK